MPWIQLRLAAVPAQVEALEDALLDVGAAAVTLEDSADQPVYEPGVNERLVWDRTRVTGLFDADTDMQEVLTALQQQLGRTPGEHRIEILEDKDWEREWMSRYQPIRCGTRLWICPSWCPPQDPQAVNLMLDPGLAFGTGTHPTTFLCLQWLDGQSLTGKTVVDYGCGSGILGIAALLLGAARVVAVDNDPQALTATLDNARRNGFAQDRIQCVAPDAVPDNLHGDIVLANILAAPLLALAPRLSALLVPGGRLALSGILASQADAVIARYEQWFEQAHCEQREEWVRITAVRKSFGEHPLSRME